MSEEIKVVILVKDEKASIGIQSPDCDPVFLTHEGGLEEILDELPDLVEQARRKWADNPRYPKTERATPAPASRPTTPPVSRPTTPRKPAPQQQMF